MEIENVMEDRESDGEDNQVDAKKHSRLLSAMAAMDSGTKRTKVEQRTEPSLEVSEFNLSSTADKGVKLYQLLGSLGNTGAHSQLKKQLIKVQKGKKRLDLPLHQHEAEKIQRIIAYKKTSKDISKWDEVVKGNRRAEHLSFPLNQPRIGLQTTEQFVKRFKPGTPLEQEVYQLLNGNKYAERMDRELTKAEEEVLSAMSLEEAQARRSELQKARALMSYQEAKCKRQKKIKSKKYRRIQRKSRAKEENKRLEELMKTNPEEAEEQMNRMEKSRAEERLTLRHRNTGKWAQQANRFSKFNEETKHQLADQLQKSRALTEKVAQALESDEEDKEDAVSEEAGKLSLRDLNNPWFGGKEKEPEEKEEKGKRFEGDEYSLPQEVTAAREEEEDEEDEEVDEDEHAKELERLQEKRKRRKAKSSGKNDIEIDLSGSSGKEKLSKRKNISDLKKILEKRKNKEEVVKEDVSEDDDDDDVAEFINDVKRNQKGGKMEEDTSDAQGGVLSEDLTRRQSMKELSENWSEDDEEISNNKRGIEGDADQEENDQILGNDNQISGNAENEDESNSKQKRTVRDGSKKKKVPTATLR